MTGTARGRVNQVFCAAVLALMLAVPGLASAEYGWSASMGGLYSGGLGRAMAADPENNLLLAGTFSGRIDFGAAFEQVDVKTADGPYPNLDVFVTALSPEPAYRWGYRIGGPGNEIGNAIVSDAEGNVYVAGSFDDIVNFATYDWPMLLKTPAGGRDIFITRINADRTHGWTRVMGGLADDEALGLALGGDGALYLTGYFQDTVDFAADFGGSYALTSNGLGDAFVMRLTRDGGYGWARRMGGTADDAARAIAADPSGGLVVAGVFGGLVDFGGGFDAPGVSVKNKATGAAGFIAAIGTDASWGWARMLGDSSANSVGLTSLSLDPDGNFFVTGWFDGTVDFASDFGAADLKLAAGAADVFTTRIDADQSYGWTRRMGGDSAEGDQGAAIAAADDGRVYVSGVFGNTVDFAADFGGADILHAAGLGAFFSCLGADGSYEWTTGPNAGETADATSAGGAIFAAPDGAVYASGTFAGGTSDFGAALGFSEPLVGDTSSDILLVQLNAPPTTPEPPAVKDDDDEDSSGGCSLGATGSGPGPWFMLPMLLVFGWRLARGREGRKA